jgi:hypothetical protein
MPEKEDRHTTGKLKKAEPAQATSRFRCNNIVFFLSGWAVITDDNFVEQKPGIKRCSRHNTMERGTNAPHNSQKRPYKAEIPETTLLNTGKKQ